MKQLKILLLVTSFGMAEKHDVQRQPLSIRSTIEFGHIIKGYETEYDQKLHGDVVPRLGVSMMQELAVNRNFDMKLGVGGLFWYSFPAQTGLGFSHVTRFGPGISNASARYHFGDAEKENLYLQFGFFPMKYNWDAYNLGEYLLRSTPYPGTVWTGGWSIVNSAAYMAQGARLHWEFRDGALTQDLNLFMERDFAPMADLTPSYLVNFKAGGIFEIGAGVAFHHYIPMKPSRLEPDLAQNTYVTYDYYPATPAVYDTTGEIVAGAQEVLVTQQGNAAGPREGLYHALYEVYDAGGRPITDNNPYDAKILEDVLNPGVGRYAEQVLLDQAYFNANQITTLTDNMSNEQVFTDAMTGALVDSSGITDFNEILYSNVQTGELVTQNTGAAGVGAYAPTSIKRYQPQDRYRETETDLYPRNETHYTFKGIKLMGKVALDFKPLLGLDGSMGHHDLRLFSEVAVLGVKDYPHYYNDIKNRIPVMFGFNVPTFGLLDLLSLQAEYFNSYYPNNSRLLQFQVIPVPYVEDVEEFEPTDKDNWSWSVLARRSLGPAFNVYAQVANDHFRTITFQGRPSYAPVVQRPSDWYYIIKMEFGI